MKHYQPAKDLLKDRIILITGAGSGIGKTAALTFAEHGATVILVGRTEKKLEAVYDEIERNGWPKPALFPVDMTKATAGDLQAMAAAVQNEFGRLDGLLHNAAILGTLTPLALYDDELWNKVTQVNLRAPYLLTRACLDLLNQSEGASVIFTTADVARKGKAYWGAYAIAGAGVERMAEIWADELESNTSIRVNTLDPGPARTFFRANAFPGENPKTAPLPETLMGTYLYLIGPDSKEIRGRTFSAQK